MVLKLHKYQGAGNDFILLDNRAGLYKPTALQIRRWCDRHFGIGADGFIELGLFPGADYEMAYYNADGLPGSMCGNGARCTAHFARSLGLCTHQATFQAYDGLHQARFNGDGTISITMGLADAPEPFGKAFLLDTGSPHYVVKTAALDTLHVKEEGQRIRYSERFREDGINVNFIELTPNGLRMRTYERGVEDETLSCGTGTVAAAIVFYRLRQLAGKQDITVQAPGGTLLVQLEQQDGCFPQPILRGPAEAVFVAEVVLL